jgi:hypothetical protein
MIIGAAPKGQKSALRTSVDQVSDLVNDVLLDAPVVAVI